MPDYTSGLSMLVEEILAVAHDDSANIPQLYDRREPKPPHIPEFVDKVRQLKLEIRENKLRQKRAKIELAWLLPAVLRETEVRARKHDGIITPYFDLAVNLSRIFKLPETRDWFDRQKSAILKQTRTGSKGFWGDVTARSILSVGEDLGKFDQEALPLG